MPSIPALRLPASALLALASGGCFDTGASNLEMRAAVGEVVAQGQAQAIETEIIELTTSFTLGDGVQAIAEEIRTFIETQVPCSTIEIADDTLTIDFGTLDDACTYNGHTYAGVITVQVQVEGSKTIVDHTYSALTNGEITLDGTKVVTWEAKSRNVVTDYDFTTKEGKTIAATSDRTQTLLDEAAGLQGGIVINGERKWVGESGAWDLSIEDVEVRWVDPVPQAGLYSLTTPKDKVIDMSFERQDEDTIRITVDGGRRIRIYDVTQGGAVADQGEG